MDIATLKLTDRELDLLVKLAAQGLWAKKTYQGHSQTDALDMVCMLKSKLNEMVGA